jgi:NADPH2:quinone reductase
MRAARLHAFGEPLRLADVPPAAPTQDEVLVRLTHASVNPLDIRLCEGGAGRPPLPFVPGCDGVGHTDDGPVAVHGDGIGTLRPGTFAERICAPRAAVVPVPDGVDLGSAAAIGLVGATASYVVRQTAGVTAADRVLVLGATGAVGMLAVQVAVATGATVWAHAGRDVPVVAGLGAERTVVTTAAGLRDAVRELRPTVVVDGLGGEFTSAAVRSLATGGRLALYGVAAAGRADIDLATVYRRGIAIRGVATRNLPAAATSAALTDCLTLAADGRLRPVVADRVPLAEVNTALDRLAGRGTTGKLLLTIG